MSNIREQVAALEGKRALVCAAKATVTRDHRRPTPYPTQGDLVGEISTLRDEHFYLVGWSFVTQIKWEDVRAVWPRDEAPDPCPNCGGSR